MADPLSLLREFVSGGKIEEVALQGDRVDFGGKFSFGKNVPTGYKSQQGKGNFYDLETLLFFARHIDIKFGEYFKKAGKELGKQVSFVDRKDLQEYLTGRSDRSEFIQLTVPDLEVQHPAKRARLEEGGEAAAGPSTAAPAEQEGAEAAALRRIRENEVQLRDRNSMLSVPGRSFRKVLTILSQVQREQAVRDHLQKEEQRKQRATQKPMLPVKPSGRYERQTQQDATLKQMGAAELGVQVGFKPTQAAATGAAPPPPPPQQGAAPPPPPSRHQRPHPQQQQAQQQRDRGAGSSRAGAPASRHAQQQRAPPGKVPIIMVPPGMTALLNMHNIRSFLEAGDFKTTEQAKQEKAAADAAADAEAAERAKAEGKPAPKPRAGVKQDQVAITRTIGRPARGVKYIVTDKEPSSRADWDRVVAVVCLGKAWQFKKWPFKGAATGDLVDTFSRVLGVFVHYTDEQVDATVKSWNVKILGLNRGSRHRDATVAQEFWRLLDAFLQARSSSLAY